MATSRAPCQSCSLPFYTDENDLCPYCGQVAPDGGVTDDSPSHVPARSRATCDTCGLAYYDDHGECPYCAAADERAAAVETSTAEGEPETPGEQADATDSSTETATAAAARARVTCDTCGLAYYADETDACPYCARAEAATAHGDGAADSDDGGDTETADATETEPDREQEPDREPVDDPAATGTTATGDDESDETSDDERPSSFLGTLLRPLRKLFGG